MRAITNIILLSILLYSCTDAPKESDEATTKEVQQEEVTKPKNVTLEDLTPEGYTLFKTFKGDLNRDEYEDMIAVFDAQDNEDMINRAVVIITTDKDGKLKMEALNKDGAYCAECGGMMGDPLANVVIKSGYFTIEHFGGSRTKWTNDPTFKYNEEDGKWYLHRHSKVTQDGFDPEADETIMLTTKDFGVVNFEDFKY